MDITFIKNMIAGWVRTLLTPLAAWLAFNGYLGDDDAVKLIAIIGSLIVALAWSAWNKFFAEERVEAALDMNAGTSKEQLDAVLENR